MEKKTRLTGASYEVARLKKKSDILTARINTLVKERNRYDKARAELLVDSTEPENAGE
jgi:hypothetical protein